MEAYTNYSDYANNNNINTEKLNFTLKFYPDKKFKFDKNNTIIQEAPLFVNSSSSGLQICKNITKMKRAKFIF